MAIVGMKYPEGHQTERSLPLAEQMDNNLTVCINMATDIFLLAQSLSALLLNPRPCESEEDSRKGEGLIPRAVSNLENLRKLLAKINEELRYVESEIFCSVDVERGAAVKLLDKQQRR